MMSMLASKTFARFRILFDETLIKNYPGISTAYTVPAVSYNLADVTKNDVNFRLFTNQSKEEELLLTVDGVHSAKVADVPTKLFIHGWKSSGTGRWYQPLKDAYFQRGDYNIVYVDWSRPANEDYKVSIANVKPIGHFIGDFILASKVKLQLVHIVGHSLGAHVASFAGKRIFEETGSKVGRITATDPAGPGFEHVDVGTDGRLSSTDADFVDVIHTDIGHYGYIHPIGTVDFYPNGGKMQPGCPPYEEDVNCSHARSNLYFIESVNSDGFKARRCSSWQDFEDKKYEDDEVIIFGESVPRNAKGKYFFSTNSEPPFAMK